LAKEFDLEHLEAALSHCCNSAPGLDVLKFILLKRLPEGGKRNLLDIFNEILLTAEIPAAQDESCSNIEAWEGP
jgi:hypothetical protein